MEMPTSAPFSNRSTLWPATPLRRILIHDQADRDAIASQLLRYGDGEATTGPTSSTC
jgi:hypothetical protein